jgi:hypothetical protein
MKGWTSPGLAWTSGSLIEEDLRAKPSPRTTALDPALPYSVCRTTRAVRRPVPGRTALARNRHIRRFRSILTIRPASCDNPRVAAFGSGTELNCGALSGPGRSLPKIENNSYTFSGC